MRGLESEARIGLGMTDDHHSRISMLAARLESGANQLAAYAGALILRPN